MKKYLAAALVLLLLAMVLPSCSAAPTGLQNQSSGNTNFRLLVSDEPNDIGDFYSLNVTISEVGVLSADTDNWTEVDVDPPAVVDLTKLQGDNASEVWTGSITSGNYTKVFIYVDNVTGILADNSSGTPQAGDNATVKLPGGKLQISKPFEVTQVDGSAIVSFVFDITVIKAGKSGQYILKPQVAASGADQHFNDVTAGASQSEGKGGGKPETPGVGRGQPDGVASGTSNMPQDLPTNRGPKR